MEIVTVKGRYYVVTSPNGGTVTDAAGGLCITLSPGEQRVVWATDDKLILDDPSGSIIAGFKKAPAALGLLGGGNNSLPAEYTRLEFLESTGTQYINTGENINGTSGLFGIFEPVGATPNGWAISAGVFYGGAAFSPLIRYQNNVGFQYRDITRYPLTDGTWASAGAKIGNLGCKLKEKCQVALNWLNDHQWLLEFNAERIVYSELPDMKGPNKTLYLFARRYEDGTAERESVRIYKIQLSQGEQGTNAFIPALAPTGAPCMFDTVSKQPFSNSGSGEFIAGVKDAAQLRTVLRKLPDLTGQDMGTLTLSIPAEANNPEMQELLDTTETQKNWELTLQERDAAAATYSLRRVRKVVWVRKLRAENGSYVDADGLRWQAEWCSAIYSPRGNDPTLHGYEPFDSVEQAVEVWGLVPYEYPEEELSNIA